MSCARQMVPIALVLSVVLLAACSSGHDSSGSSATAASGGDVSSASTAGGHFHAELTLAGQPSVSGDGKNIVVDVSVTNDGTSPFGTRATPVHNVNLGAHAIDASGKVVANDLARGSMPEVAPGATVKATILLPVGKVLGYSAELVPVEEGVGWFDQWGTKPLSVGPFKKCGVGQAGTVCGASGNPLPVVPLRQ